MNEWDLKVVSDQVNVIDELVVAGQFGRNKS